MTFIDFQAYAIETMTKCRLETAMPDGVANPVSQSEVLETCLAWIGTIEQLESDSLSFRFAKMQEIEKTGVTNSEKDRLLHWSEEYNLHKEVSRLASRLCSKMSGLQSAIKFKSKPGGM